MARELGQNIRALNDKLLTFSSGAYRSLTEFEDSLFEKPTSGIWLRQKTFWKKPRIMGSFYGNYREQGIYQIEIMSLVGQGAVEAADISGELVQWFGRGSTLTTSNIPVKIEQSYRMTAAKDGSWSSTPVAVEFWAYTSIGS